MLLQKVIISICSFYDNHYLSTFTQGHFENFHLFVTQFTIVSPVLSLAHVSLTITGEDGTHGGHHIGVVHFFSVYLAVYGVLSLEHSIRPIFEDTNISLINKFWCLKTQLFLIVLQPVLFESNLFCSKQITIF